MAKKVIQLTESEIQLIIRDVTLKSLNGEDRERYARMWEASRKAVDQQSSLSTLNSFPEYQYMFFSRDSRDMGFRVIFSFENTYKIKDNCIILSGEIVFNQECYHGQIRIVNNRISIRKDNSVYPLIPDNRTVEKWNELITKIIQEEQQKV
jgi:hypothetical protein